LWGWPQAGQVSPSATRTGLAGEALAEGVVIGAHDEAGARVGLMQGTGNGFEAARVEGHRHRPAGGLVDAGGRRVAFGHAHGQLGNLANQMELAGLLAVGQKVFVASVHLVGVDRLQAVQGAGRAAHGHQQGARDALFTPFTGAHLLPLRPGGHPQAEGRDALALQIG
jgi:hypothetical protein